MSDLASLEPKALWNLFLELSRIPRGSHHEAAAANWAAGRARALGLEVEFDEAGNVLIRKPAAPGKEGQLGLALQAHLDMVCEKNEGTEHDFSRDPIGVVSDGDWIHAKGTTLGADNGIGVAAAMAILECSNLRHPALEVLLTVDEETGLSGARSLQPGWLRAKRLLNLDSEDDREITIGCAGGVDSIATRPVEFHAAPPGGKPMRLLVHGLRGGHSGIDIGANRGNALRILGQVLAELAARHSIQLADVRGGNKRNAIPREAAAVMHCSSEQAGSIVASVERLASEWKLAFGAFEPNFALSIEPLASDDLRSQRALAPSDADAIVDMLLSLPNGVEAMSPSIPNLVQTSTNLAVAEIADSRACIALLTRSSIEASKAALVARIAAVAKRAGFSLECSSDYPGWNPVPDAGLVKLVNGVHVELYGEPMIVRAMHAGLECGIIGRKYPDMEMASIGPSMFDVHTPDERVSVSSVQRFWHLLTHVIERV